MARVCLRRIEDGSESLLLHSDVVRSPYLRGEPSVRIGERLLTASSNQFTLSFCAVSADRIALPGVPQHICADGYCSF